jgi:hypothetical protein
MLTQLSLLFIIFILLIFTIVVFFSRRKAMENFTTPTAVNVPAANNTDGLPFYVGNDEPMKPEDPIVSSEGLYRFRKPQLLYDGVWGEKCELNGKGDEICDWKVTSSNYPLDKKDMVYGTNTFFHLPEKELPMNGAVISPPDCPATAKMYDNGPTYEEYQKINPPVYLNKPDIEDILGFYPKNNNNMVELPPPKIGNL